MEDQVRAILQQDDTILFIGSGISCWSGLPSWQTLIQELAEFLELRGHDIAAVKNEITRGDLLQAASYGFDLLTLPQSGEFLRRALRVGLAQPHEIHQRISQLGPRCFITTNFDRLIEESLRRWQSDRYYRIVTNRHLVETAEIAQARSMDFVFKLHGDIEDIQSIIVTREQYRRLLPDGEYHRALETARMLLATRPVVYLGFGLRDPDFYYVRDLLANTYKGAIRDHYAIVADVTEIEIDYWRRHYGIHLITYPTTTNSDGSRKHSALLQMLERLQEKDTLSVVAALPKADTDNANFVLALARHAARLMRVEKPEMTFPLRVTTADKRSGRARTFRWDRFEHSRVERLLDSGPERFVLVGYPGAGKSFALRHSAARLAEKLYERCLLDSFVREGVTIPIVSDLKLYSGNLWSLVEKTLPAGLSLSGLLSGFRLRIYLDAFNEMPREYLESGIWEGDFTNFLEKISPAGVIIASRTTDGLSKLNLPAYCLDELDYHFVERELERRDIVVAGRFTREIQTLFQKPFYFNLIANNAIKLPTEPHPRDVYHSFFSGLTSQTAERFWTADG